MPFWEFGQLDSIRFDDFLHELFVRLGVVFVYCFVHFQGVGDLHVENKSFLCRKQGLDRRGHRTRTVVASLFTNARGNRLSNRFDGWGIGGSTFMKKSGMPSLTLEFFEEISRTMGEQLVLVFARHQQRYVAGAIMLRGDDALFGRHWGCLEEFNSLHFEACYYQGIEYCIENEFNQLLKAALTKTTSDEIKDFFYTVGVQHQNFGRLVNEERELIRIAKPYPSDRYAAEKKKNTDNIIELLKKTRHTGERNVFTKILNLSESSDRAINFSRIILVLALSTGLWV